MAAAALLRDDIRMVVVICDLLEERSRLQNESGEDHPRQIHSGTHLLHEEPHNGLVLVGNFFGLIEKLELESTSFLLWVAALPDRWLSQKLHR